MPADLYSDEVAVTSKNGRWAYRELGERADALVVALTELGVTNVLGPEASHG